MPVSAGSATALGPGLVLVDVTPAAGAPVALSRAGLAAPPAASASTANVLVGSGPFAGSASGTAFGAALAAGFTGSLLDLQRGGASQARVDANGNLYLGSAGNGNRTLFINNGNAGGDIAALTVTAANQTVLRGAAGATLVLSDTLYVQVAGSTKLSVGPTGALAITPATTTTAPAAGTAGAVPSQPSGWATITINNVARQIPYW